MTRTGPIHGREPELNLFDTLLADIEEHGQGVLVRGDAGIGKSSLVQEVAQRARARRITVLETTGIEAESGLPYAGLHRLLAPLLDEVERLPETQRRALLTALGMQEGPAPQVFLVALATLGLLTDRTATRPVVAVIDDVQWLDPPTSEALAFVARRVQHDPVLLVAAHRNGTPETFWRGGLLEIDVAALNDTAARAVLADTASDLRSADRERILAEAAGNPLALVELPLAWRRSPRDPSDVSVAYLPLSSRLERAFAARLGELPAPTRAAVLVAAVTHESELIEILAATSVLVDATVTADVLEPAAHADLLTYDARRLQFRHPLVRSAVIQAEPTARRRAAHAALADALAAQPYRRTWHRAQAIIGPDDALADELEAGHLESLRRGWVGAAIAALERSAELTTDQERRGRRLLRAAELSFGLGRSDIVDRLVTAAERHSLSELDRARVEWLREIFSDGIPGDAARVLELCDVAERSARVGDLDLALNLLLGAALRCWWADTGPDARARVARVTDSLTAAQDDPRHIAALAVAEPILRGGDVIARLARIRIETVTDADALRVLGMAAHAVGDQVRASDFLDRAESRLRTQGRLGLLPHVLGMQGAVRLDTGDWARSVMASEEGRLVAADTGQPVWSTGTLVNEARVRGLLGDGGRALELAAEADTRPTLRALNDFLACAQLARGFAFLTSGRHDDAYAAFERVFDPLDPSHHQREQLGAIMYLAEAAVHCGRTEDARKIVAEMERLATVTPSPVLQVHLLYARPVLADDADAEPLYRAALRADLSRWPLHRARIEHAYGSWLRRQRRVAESREPLRNAAAAYSVIGAASWAELARGELRAAGERSDPGQTAAVAALSPQELQIARLAAAGLSNREIGQQLFLSPRTVGSHLYRIFPKLDITSRTQLASRLER